MSLLTVVNPEDNVIGSATYDEIHSKGILHRLVLVYVFDSYGRFFLQKRARNKVHGCLYGESVCSHVRKGEDYLETAKRGLSEELGLEDIYPREVTKKLVYTEDKEWKNNTFVKIYDCIANKPIIINKREVQEGDFYHIKYVLQKYLEAPELFVPGFKQTFTLYLDTKLEEKS